MELGVEDLAIFRLGGTQGQLESEDARCQGDRRGGAIVYIDTVEKVRYACRSMLDAVQIRLTL